MPNEYTNLLPGERLHSLRRTYWMRLAVVTVWFVAALTLAAAILLLPTYFLLSQTTGEKQEQLTSLRVSLSSVDERALEARLAALTRYADTLDVLQEEASVSQVLRAVLAVTHPGIALTGFSYVPTSEEVEATLRVEGVAATRAALRSYQLALERAPFAASASLPVSAYAKDSEIPFMITVTLIPSSP